MSPEKLPKMYKNILNKCWKYDQHEGTFYPLWWTCNKEKKMDINALIYPEDLKDQSIIEARGFFCWD